MYDVILVQNEVQGKDLLRQLDGKNPLFICVIGSTETARIPGLSAAGQNPNLVNFTPPADVEFLLLGKCRCMHGLPVTPEGIPTPALISRSTLKLANIPILVVSGGLWVKPQIPFVDLGGKPGKDIRTGKAVEDVEEIMCRAKITGENLSKIADYLVVGESIPGGTTTALGVLLAMGVDARGKVSSSMVKNPHSLKNIVVEAGLRASKVEFGALARDPKKAIALMGDPVIPAFAGLVIGAASDVPVLMAGGTQMGAILAVIKALHPNLLENIAIGTTRWIIEDQMADLKGLIAEIADVPILAADLNFRRSKFEGLMAYEKGAVKDGVGAGGTMIAAMMKSEGSLKMDHILEEIERDYERLKAL